MKQEFTYRWYREFLNIIREKEYYIKNFRDIYDDKMYWGGESECRGLGYTVLLRHDIDMSLEKALRIAEIEFDEGIKSTYFVMLTSSYYNLFDRKNRETMKKILQMGHEIGLHYDESSYGVCLNKEEIVRTIRKEVNLLESLTGTEITSLSMHIPNKRLFCNEYNITKTDGCPLLNAYHKQFVNGFKYVSDSTMRWREPVIEILNRKLYDKIQILTHPLWYAEEQLTDIEVIKSLILKKEKEIVNYANEIRPGYLN